MNQKGLTPIIIIIVLVLFGIVGGTYYLSKSSASPLSSADACSSNKDAILGLVVHFENLQKKMDAKGVLQLFTPPQTQSEKETYTNLSGKDNGNLPRLYGNVSYNIKVPSYKITDLPTKVGNACGIIVTESRSYYGGPSNPQYLPTKSQDFKLIFTQKENKWFIDQYQSQDPNVSIGKYSGWASELISKGQTTNYETHTDSYYHYSFQYPKGWFSETCEQTWVFIAPTKDLLGTCGVQNGKTVSDFSGGGLIVIASGVPASIYEDANDTYRNTIAVYRYTNLSYLDNGKREDVMVGGYPGIKISGVYKKTYAKAENEGNTFIEYVVNTNEGPLVITYNSKPSWGNYTDEFEKLVSTIKFTQ